MRSDMNHVVYDIRHPHNAGSEKTGKRLSANEIADAYDDYMGDDIGFDSGETHLPPSGTRTRDWDDCHGCFRHAPINRWLHAQVGRPWDKVFSEMAQTLKSNVRESFVNRYFGAVQTNVFMNGYGEVYDSRSRALSDGKLYVHPTTGLLKKAKRGNGDRQAKAMRLHWEQEKKKNPKPYHYEEPARTEVYLVRAGALVPLNKYRKHPEEEQDGHITLAQVDGIWYHYIYTKHWYHVAASVVNGITKRPAHMEWSWRHVKRQLSHEELKTYGLTNTPAIKPMSRRKHARLSKAA